MVERVFRLGDRSVKGIMTPRTEICWLDLEASPEANVAKVMASRHARFPVARGNLDACVGVVRGNRLLRAQLAGETVDLETLVEPPLYVTESARGMGVVQEFRSSGVHIALVMDEYGGIEGLVTLTDLIEAIVGDLPSTEELEDPMIVQREDGSWLLDGLLDLEDFSSLLERKAVPEKDAGGAHTLGGFVMHRLGRVPKAGDHFEWNGLRFEVMDMDGKRVDKVLVESL
jgi:putative hemolysin